MLSQFCPSPEQQNVGIILNGREKNNSIKPCVEAKYTDGERMFLSRAALLICKAHVNAGSVTCHLRGSKSTITVAFCICWSSFYSSFSWSTGSDIIYSPHLIPTHPHTVKRIRPTHMKHKDTEQPSTKIQQFVAKLWGHIINLAWNRFLMCNNAFSSW